MAASNRPTIAETSAVAAIGPTGLANRPEPGRSRLKQVPIRDTCLVDSVLSNLAAGPDAEHAIAIDGHVLQMNVLIGDDTGNGIPTDDNVSYANAGACDPRSREAGNLTWADNGAD